MNRVHQKQITHRPVMGEYRSFAGGYYNSNYGVPLEIFGSYYDYDREANISLGVSTEFTEEESLTFDIDSNLYISIGEKIKIGENEVSVKEKTYNLDGTIDYYVQPSYKKCDNYEELYEIVEESAQEVLKVRRGIQEEREEMQRIEKFLGEEKREESPWWKFW